MSEIDDFLLELNNYPTVKRFIKQLGLPVPIPQALERDEQPYGPHPMRGERVVFHASPESEVLEPAVETLLRAGATIEVPGNVAEIEGLQASDEKLPGELVEIDLDEQVDDDEFDALILDATTTERLAQLDRLYEFFHPRLRAMRRSARALVIGRPVEEAEAAEQAAAWRGLEGFTRSLAKELGRYGSTANLIRVERGAEDRLAGPLTYFGSDRSAYVSGQPLRVRDGDGAHPQAGRERRILKGKTALVTGAARGIGRATAFQFAQEGAEVLCVDLPGVDELAEVDEEFAGIPVGVDISTEEAPAEIEARAEEHGGIDILVNNAGITRDRTLANMTRESWNSSLAVNIEAPVRMTRRLMERELLNDWGRILCLSSIAGIAGNVGQTNYATGKAGFIGYAEWLADHLADKKITANAVAPGFIETRLTAEMPTMVREVARRMNNLSQGGRPSDVANALTFLASPSAQGISGEVLRVCGGAIVGA